MPLTLDDLAARVAKLEAIEDIRKLKARYLRSCDLKLADELLDTLLPEGAVIAYDGFPEFTDRETFVAIYRQMGCQPWIFDIHHATNADVHLTAADRAEGLWSLHFQSIDLSARTVTVMGVEYRDVYRHQGGRWWIAETRTRRTSCLIQTIDQNGTPTYGVIGEPPASYGQSE